MEDIRVILLVEDNSSDEMFALRALKKASISIQIDIARDGAEALEYLTDLERSCPDLVLLDLKLPRVSGIEVLRSIRASDRTRRVPVVVFTTTNEPAEVEACIDSGANSFVRKPVDFSEYTEKILKIADYWLCTSEPMKPATPSGVRHAPLLKLR